MDYMKVYCSGQNLIPARITTHVQWQEHVRSSQDAHSEISTMTKSDDNPHSQL